MGSWSIMHWVVVLLVVVLVFGTKKLRNLGKDLGGAVHDFKQGLNEGTNEGAQSPRAVENAQGNNPTAQNAQNVSGSPDAAVKSQVNEQDKAS